ncbi:MAG: hypothetical protein Q8K60_09650 [Parachlamydiaceae bacterium]|nr:hypothetical protein [Parachlamydiaceae bacterium]
MADGALQMIVEAPFVLAYGCGPNILVGSTVVLSNLAASSTRKVHEVILDVKENFTTNEAVRMNLQWKKDSIVAKREHNKERVERWAISMIPIFGPFKARYGSKYES